MPVSEVPQTDQEDPAFVSDAYSEECQRARQQLEDFWAQEADALSWYKKWDAVLDQTQAPFCKWFVGGEINACYNAVDRHVESGYGDSVAIIYDSPLANEVRYISYKDLVEQVSKLAGVLVKLGVEKGDRVIIYMPTIPESVFAMLACARIGAVHVQVYGGFSAKVLAQRIDSIEPKVLVTASHDVQPDGVVFYQAKVEDAISLCSHKPRRTLIYVRRGEEPSPLILGRDVSWDVAMESAIPHDCVPVSATDPLFILHTSGTTGEAKATVVATGGYLAALVSNNRTGFGISRKDTWWCYTNLAWPGGHNGVCYGTLIHGATSVIFDGYPVGTPNPGAFFRIISEHNVNYLACNPNVFRAMRREDPQALKRGKFTVYSLRAVVLGGEQTDEITKDWIQTYFAPVFSLMGQTEFGYVTSSCIALGHPKVQQCGSCGLPAPGVDVCILRTDGSECDAAETGRIAIRLPLHPGAACTLYNNDQLFVETYLRRYPGYFDTHDVGYMDDNGFLFVVGPAEDAIRVHGRNVVAPDIEGVMMTHPAVAECLVVGAVDAQNTQTPVALYVISSGSTDEISQVTEEIQRMVAEIMDPAVSQFKVACVPVLPKNANGKTMRSAITAVVSGKELSPPEMAARPDEFRLLWKGLKLAGILAN